MLPNRFFSENTSITRLNSTTLIPDYLFLLFGFFGGNLFSSIFSILPLPPIFIILAVVVTFELTAYLYYNLLLVPPLQKQAHGTRPPPFLLFFSFFRRTSTRLRLLLYEVSKKQKPQSFFFVLLTALQMLKQLLTTCCACFLQSKRQARAYFAVLTSCLCICETSTCKAKATATLLASYYENKHSKQVKQSKQKKSKFKRKRILFLVKLGLLFGLFVDAFKVGS